MRIRINSQEKRTIAFDSSQLTIYAAQAIASGLAVSSGLLSTKAVVSNWLNKQTKCDEELRMSCVKTDSKCDEELV